MLDRFLLFPRRSPLRTNVSRLTFFLHAGPRISTVLSTQLISFSVRWKRERTLAVRANRLSLACRYLPRENGGPIMYTGNLGKSFEKRGSGSRSRYSRPWRTCPANSEITRRPHERIDKLSRGKGPTITPRCSIPVFPLGPFLQGEIMNFDIQPASGVMKFSSHLSSRLLFPSTTFISTRVRGTKFVSLARMVVVDGKITRPITYR